MGTLYHISYIIIFYDSPSSSTALVRWVLCLRAAPMERNLPLVLCLLHALSLWLLRKKGGLPISKPGKPFLPILTSDGRFHLEPISRTKSLYPHIWRVSRTESARYGPNRVCTVLVKLSFSLFVYLANILLSKVTWELWIPMRRGDVVDLYLMRPDSTCYASP
jgi:hypothetical protein